MGVRRLTLFQSIGSQTDAAKRAAVAAAVEDIHTLIRGQRLVPKAPPNYAAAPPPGYQNAPPPDQLGFPPPGAPPQNPYGGPPPAAAPSVSLYLGFEAPPDFNLASRLQGPGALLLLPLSRESQ